MTSKNADPTDDYVATITDCRDAGFCARGMAAYFKALGLDYKEFKNGQITVGRLRQCLPDANVDAVIRVVIEREQENNGRE